MVDLLTERTGKLSALFVVIQSVCWGLGCTVSFGGGEKSVCGNGILEEREECDDGNLVDGDGCSSDCKVEPGWECTGEPSVCESVAVCGDGKAEGDESCDGTDLRGQTCEGLGYGPGELACNADCEFETRGCGPPPDCGNGILDQNEVCDGDELGGMTCEALGYYGGLLGCLDDCSGFDVSGCGGRCGDGVVDEPEKCDGDNLDGKNCAYFGLYGGELGCLEDCSDFDKSDCWDEPIVLINEVSTGATDWVELLNVSSVGVDLQAWVLAWEAVTAGEIQTGWSALPSVMVFPGERLTITEDPGNSGGQPYLSGESDVQLGKNIPWGRFGGGAVLYDPSDRPTDMIRWGESTFEVEGTGWVDMPGPLPGYQKEGVSFSRVPDGYDSDRSGDFCFSQSTKGLSNLLPCLQPYGPSSLLITEVSGGGLWNAEMIEVYNPGNETVQLENWQVVTNRTLGTNFLVLPSYTLDPGAYAHIVCNVGVFGQHHVDENGIIRIRSMSWNPGGTNYLVLREPVVGLGVDFLRWGGSTMIPWSPDDWYDDDKGLTMPDRTLSLGRIGIEDTNSSDDWCVQEQSFGESNFECIQ